MKWALRHGAPICVYLCSSVVPNFLNCATPGRAFGAVFEDDAGSDHLLADAVGGGEVLGLAGGGTSGDLLFDPGRIALRRALALQPVGGIVLQQTKQLAV